GYTPLPISGGEDVKEDAEQGHPRDGEREQKVEARRPQHDHGQDQRRQIEKADDLQMPDLEPAIPLAFEDQLSRQALIHVERMKDRVHAPPLEAAKVPHLKSSSHLFQEQFATALHS